jgi:hypothetical protein
MECMVGVSIDCPHSIRNLPRKLQRPRPKPSAPCGGIISCVCNFDKGFEETRGVRRNATQHSGRNAKRAGWHSTKQPDVFAIAADLRRRERSSSIGSHVCWYYYRRRHKVGN